MYAAVVALIPSTSPPPPPLSFHFSSQRPACHGKCAMDDQGCTNVERSPRRQGAGHTRPDPPTASTRPDTRHGSGRYGGGRGRSGRYGRDSGSGRKGSGRHGRDSGRKGSRQRRSRRGNRKSLSLKEKRWIGHLWRPGRCGVKKGQGVGGISDSGGIGVWKERGEW